MRLTEIYGRVTQIKAVKTSGPYRGKRFYHDFKPGVRALGVPSGAVIKFPGGVQKVNKKAVLLLSDKHDIWGLF
jgi:hypothetical protein